MPWNHPDKIPAPELARLRETLSRHYVLLWAIGQLRETSSHSGYRDAWMAALFSANELEKIYEQGDSFLQNELLEAIPPEHWAENVEMLFQAFPQTPTPALAQVLLKLAPRRLREMLDDLAGEDETARVQQQQFLVLLYQLQIEEDAFGDVDALEDLLLSSEVPLRFQMLSRVHTEKLLQHDPEAVIEVIDESAEDERVFSMVFQLVARAIAPANPWLDLVLRWQEIAASEPLSQVARLFDKNAPLKEAEALLNASANKFRKAAPAFFLSAIEARRPELTPFARMVAKLHLSNRRSEGELHRQLVSLALCLWGKSEHDALPLEDLVELLDSPVPWLLHKNFAAIRSRFEEASTPELTARLVERYRAAEQAETNLVFALAAVRAPEAVQALLEWIEADEENNEEEAFEQLLRLGPEIEATLVEAFPDYSPRVQNVVLRALGVLGDEQTVNLMVQIWPAMRKQRLNIWMHVAALLTDPRLLKIAESELKRNHEAVQSTFLILGHVLGTDSARLNDVASEMEDAYSEFKNNPLTATKVPIEAVCLQCGFLNQFELTQVEVVDEPAEEFRAVNLSPCPECGDSESQYLPESTFEFIEKLLDLSEMVAARGEVPRSPILRYPHNFPFYVDFESAEAREQYAKEILAEDEHNPGALTLLALSHLDNNRFSQAKSCAERVLQQKPFAVEATFVVLAILMETQDTELFMPHLSRLEKMQQNRHKWHCYHDVEFEEALEEVLEQWRPLLQKVKQFRTLGGGLAQPASTHTAVRGPSPNDPCPCGSGKKFKKCCGRMV